MHDINLRNCLLCGEETVLFFPENDVLLKCTGCGVVFDESSNLGEGYYENERVTNVDEKKIKPRKRNAKQRVKLIRNVLKKESSLVDIGCGEGLFLQEAKNYVNAVYGIEPTKSYVAYAKGKMNLEILQGTLENIEYPDDSFDIVTMFHILEHLSLPSQALTKIYSWLKKNGHIVIEVPNIESPTAQCKGLNWELICTEHRFYFSPSSLRYLLEKNHFKIVSMRFRDFDQYRTGIGTNLRKLGITFGNIKNKKQIKTAEKQTHPHSAQKPNSSVLRSIRRTIQLPLKVFLGWLVLKFNRGDYLFVIARKT
ncbi:MAG: class I SAM-dependent methyltransferase [Deltaproteobacteria bacterium]|nr:class I SAM-dependent methyltransferase [Deltaproteobacteria bacterium]